MGNPIHVRVVRGNILNVLSNAIVLPANTSLREGRGTSAAIFEAAGRQELTAACRKIGFCEEGKAVVTPGFALKADYIIHSVVPRWIDGQHNEYERLCASYLAGLNAADILGCESISFPLLGSGNNGYDLRLAFDIAYQTMRQFEGNVLNTSYLTVFGDRAAAIVSSKGIPFIELSEAYIPNSFVISEVEAPIKKGAAEEAIKLVGDFLGKKENWEFMMDMGFKIVKLVMMIRDI